MQGQSERPAARGPGHLAWIVAGLAVLGLWWLLRDTGPCDDEYIAWRYARNLVRGGTFCFNPYGEEVEGFTCPLWIGACALAYSAHLPLLVLTSASALLAGLAASWSALVRRGRAALESDAWCALAIALSVPLAYHGAQGLGTALAAALVAWWYVLLGRGSAGRAGLLLGAATLLRPELLVLLPFHMLAAPGARSWIGALLLPALWLGIRRASFGEWLPNTFFVKKLPLLDDLGYGFAYLGQATLETGIGLLLLGLLAARWFGGRLRARVPTCALLGLACYCAGVVWVGGDYMYLARFFVPVLPLALLLAADARPPRWLWIPIVLLQFWPIARLQDLRDSQRFYEQRWIAIGEALHEHAPPGWKLATSPIGAIGWYSGLEIVDMLGITNRALRGTAPDLSVTLKGHQRHDARWVLEQKPDGIVLGNGISPRGERSLDVNAWEKELYLDPRFQAEYEARLLPIPGQTSLLYFQLRSGQPLH